MGHACTNYFSKTYIVCHRKVPKSKKITISFSGKTNIKVLKMAQNIKHFPSGTCCKHSQPLSYYYWPVIAVLQQCEDGMAAV